MDTFCHFFSMIFCQPDIFDSEREILTTRLTTENRESRQEALTGGCGLDWVLTTAALSTPWPSLGSSS